MKVTSTAVLPVLWGALRLAGPAFAGTAFPADDEQHMLELINRARADPNAEAARYPAGDYETGTADLNEGLAPGTISSAPKQPIAFNLNLVAAAQDYAETLLAQDAFTHNYAGTTPSSRMQAAGYVFAPLPAGSGENLGVTLSTGPLPVTAAEVEKHQQILFIDEGVAGRGHRVNIMNPSWREMGVGIRAGSDYFHNFRNWNAVLSVQDFAFTGGDPFLTGVAYSDADGNGFYAPGEGLGNIGITATRTSDNQQFSTTTFSSGGYSLRVPAGTYDLVATGPGLGTVNRNGVVVGSENVKVDFLPVPDNSGPTLVSAVSRKTHGSAGSFDVPLPPAPASVSGVAIEPRVNGPTQLVLTFSEPVLAADGTLDASEITLSGGGTLGTVTASGAQLTIRLSGAPETCLTLVLKGLEDAAGNVLTGDRDLQVRVLTGDGHADGEVDAADILRIKARAGQAASAEHFRHDLDANGTIDSADLQLAKTRSGRAAASCP